MTDVQSLKADLAFLRELTQDGSKGLARDGLALAVIGLTFGVICFIYWLVFSGLLAGIKAQVTWLWLVGVGAMVLAIELAKRRFPAPSGASARAMTAAWSGVGIGLIAGDLGLLAAGWRLADMAFVIATFPILLFSLYGAAWGVAFAVLRTGWFAAVSIGCFAGAIVEGLLYRSSHQWLVLSIGLFALVGLPGLAILNKARG